MDTIEYATFRYDTFEVENGLNSVNIRSVGAGLPDTGYFNKSMRSITLTSMSFFNALDAHIAVSIDRVYTMP